MGTLINDSDQCFINSIAQEVNKLAGTEIIIFQFDEVNSERDPYYQESVSREYRKDKRGKVGIICPAFVQSPDNSYVSGEEGLRTERNTQVFIAKADLDERNLRKPIIGDIYKFWGKYYNVIKSSGTSGRFSDSGETSLWEVDVSRKTNALPEGLFIDPSPTPASGLE